MDNVPGCKQLPGLGQIPINGISQNTERQYNWHTDEEKSAVKNLEEALGKALVRIAETEAQLNAAESHSSWLREIIEYYQSPEEFIRIK